MVSALGDGAIARLLRQMYGGNAADGEPVAIDGEAGAEKHAQLVQAAARGIFGKPGCHALCRGNAVKRVVEQPICPLRGDPALDLQSPADGIVRGQRQIKDRTLATMRNVGRAVALGGEATGRVTRLEFRAGRTAHVAESVQALVVGLPSLPELRRNGHRSPSALGVKQICAETVARDEE